MKREVLSFLMSVYDPLGLISHVVTILRLELQAAVLGSILLDDDNKWPDVASALTTEEEATLPAHDEGPPCIEDRYSDWRRLIHHIAYLDNFVRFLCARENDATFDKRFSAADFDEARDAIPLRPYFLGGSWHDPRLQSHPNLLRHLLDDSRNG
ncbi:hypothetical protein AND_002949 [Anopheles darlingi]|uniref:Uncharacterized protein n=1 Tax=Anopheles darlingi TaxID=43151 RepID=W5JMB0_ANODA|nr:hypothetical protein AND_002949 [Anopheles darlingi]